MSLLVCGAKRFTRRPRRPGKRPLEGLGRGAWIPAAKLPNASPSWRTNAKNSWPASPSFRQVSERSGLTDELNAALPAPSANPAAGAAR